MAQTAQRQQHPRPNILTSSPVGSPTWGCRYSIGSVIFDALTPSPLSISSPKVSDRMDTPLDHPIDIFRTTRSTKPDSLRSALQPRTKKSTSRLVLHSTKPDKAVVESKSTTEKSDKNVTLSSRTRRLASRADHPLDSHAPLRPPIGPPNKVKDAEDLDLENKIRSALSTRVRRRQISESDSPIRKSVRFDPAIVSCGSPGTNLQSKVATEYLFEHVSSPPTKSIIGKTSDTATVPIPQSNSAIMEGESGLNDCVKTIVSLKRSDRSKLRELLDALSRIDGDGDSNVQSKPTIEKSLDPQAPAFQSCSLRVHNRSGILNDGKNWSTLPAPRTPDRASIPAVWVHKSLIQSVASSQENQEDKPGLALPPVWIPRSFVHPVSTIQKYQSDKLRLSIVHPISAMEIQHGQDGYGREAKALDPDWAKSILERFAAKYPMTGKVKTETEVEKKGRLAAAIQLRLEVLLMQEREKKAVEQNTDISSA